MNVTVSTIPSGEGTASWDREPLWYKDAIIYELHVRAFRDSDGNGSGDFRGLIQKLDYLQDLGVTALWLLPFYPSPFRDDGYDISDYKSIHPLFGTLDDFCAFLDEAHRRKLYVITELILNHTSDQHAWFQRARRAPAQSSHRDFYVWSDTPDKYGGVRVIFNDTERSNWTWDDEAQSYYWHRFFSHQPDLNYANPEVQEEMLRVVDFWLNLGVDGLRLDAVPYLTEKESTTCENLPGTHDYLRRLRRHVDQHYPGRMLLAEANQWPKDAVHYFGQGDECHMAFHFPLMPRLFMAHRMELASPVIDILQQTPPIPDNCQWGIFLRNHDELTLEMVREEERNYMYRAYARDPQMRINLGIRRRLAPLLENDRRRVELLNALLFSLPGTPVIYYGDEIGLGENLKLGDRNGVRTPMQWDGSANAGFSPAQKSAIYLPVVESPGYTCSSVNVELQEANPRSLLWWMRQIIAIRKTSGAFSRGSLRLVEWQNPHVLTYLREFEKDRILVVANLSRFVQPVDIHLQEFAGYQPVEMFGGAEFPMIEKRPYSLSLAPYAFYYLRLRSPEEQRERCEIPLVEGLEQAEEILTWERRDVLAQLLPGYLRLQPHFRDFARTIGSAEVRDLFAFDPSAALALVRITFTGGDPEMYLMPLCVEEQHGGEIRENGENRIVARIQERNRSSVLLHSARRGRFPSDLFRFVCGQQIAAGRNGEMAAFLTPPFQRLEAPDDMEMLSWPLVSERRNAALLYSDLFLLKLYRRVEEGINPDLEVGRYLFEQAGFPHAPGIAGWLEYRQPDHEPALLGLMSAYAANRGSCYEFMKQSISGFVDAAWRHKSPPPLGDLWAPYSDPRPQLTEPVASLLAPALDLWSLLGTRTAELHTALAAHGEGEFSPEPSDYFHQQGLLSGMLALLRKTLALLRLRQDTLGSRSEVDRLLGLESEMAERFSDLTGLPPGWARIRIHGDLHLDQVLLAGGDLIFTDFEGENTRPLHERRIKASPLVDVAGVLRSFDYAAFAYLAKPGLHGGRKQAERSTWAHFFSGCSARAFLHSYLGSAAAAHLLPEPETAKRLLKIFLTEKAVYELNYELNSRPDDAIVPLRGLVQMFAPRNQ